MQKRLITILSAFAICLMATGSAAGQGLLYKRGDYALNFGYNQISYNAKGTGSDNDATEVYLGATISGTLDLAIATAQATGVDEASYGISGEAFPIKEKELGFPFSLSVACAYVSSGTGLDAFSVGTAIYKKARISKKVTMFPHAGVGFTDETSGGYNGEGYFIFGLPAAIQLEGASHLILLAGLALGQNTNTISLGFQISIGLN